MFWLHDSYHDNDNSNHGGSPLYGGTGGGGGFKAWLRRPVMAAINILTVLIGAFICVAGTFVMIKLIVDAYESGEVGEPFSC